MKHSKTRRRVTKTFSFDQEMFQEIVKIAKSRGVAANALVNMILNEWLASTRHLEGLPALLMMSEFMRALLPDDLNQNLIDILYRIFSSLMCRRILGVGHVNINLANVVQCGFEELLPRLGWIQSFKYVKDQDECLNLHFLHDLGDAWTDLLSLVLLRYLGSNLKLNAVIQKSQGSITIRILEKHIDGFTKENTYPTPPQLEG